MFGWFRELGQRLAPEARQPYGVPGTLRGEELQGDEPVEASLPGLVHHPHAAAAEQAEDLVAGHLGRGLAARVGRTRRGLPGNEGRPRDLRRQFGPVLGKAPQIFIQREPGLAAPAQLVLGGDQRHGDVTAAGEFRVADQVFFHPSRLPGLEAQLQVDVHKLD